LQLELDRIDKHLEFERMRPLNNMKSARESLVTSPSVFHAANNSKVSGSGIAQLNVLSGLGDTDQWSFNEHNFKGPNGLTTHVVVWKFVDENYIERTVKLRHDQDANDGYAKTLRSLEVDMDEVLAPEESTQIIFVYQLPVEDNYEPVKVQVVIDYNETLKVHFYLLFINDKEFKSPLEASDDDDNLIMIE